MENIISCSRKKEEERRGNRYVEECRISRGRKRKAMVRQWTKLGILKNKKRTMKIKRGKGIELNKN